MRSIKLLIGMAAVALVAVLAAGCGDSNSQASTSNATVNVANTDLGNVLVDSQGRTLYLFKKDSGSKSACSGACASAWPPLRASGKPTAGSDASASLLGTSKRSDGKPQVTYNGHPLYRYEGDSSSGDTNGQGLTAFGGAWYALSPAGDQVAGKPSGGGSSGGY
jgi:predicted lipoprotein with Yx(FWY)xxD motif